MKKNGFNDFFFFMELHSTACFVLHCLEIIVPPLPKVRMI